MVKQLAFGLAPSLPRLRRTRGVRAAYKASRGICFRGDSLPWLKSMPDESVDLVLTSPPFALNRKKAYGNEPESSYVEWLLPFADEVWRVLKPTGSFVLELGSAWMPGRPTRSLYQFKVLLALTGRSDKAFHLAQDFYWYNPARLPSPAQWVTIDRVRIKDSVSPIWWLSKTEHPKANNRDVLKEYSSAQHALYKNGFNAGLRPSNHRVSKEAFNRNNGGSIPSNLLPIENLLTVANTSSSDRYLKACRERGMLVHPARFPSEIPHFFISFLTEVGDVVVDPFSGSNSVGATAEDLQRRWLSCDLDLDYVKGSRYRFDPVPTLLPLGKVDIS